MPLRRQVEEVEDNDTTSHQAGIFCKDSNGEHRQEASVSATAENQKFDISAEDIYSYPSFAGPMDFYPEDEYQQKPLNLTKMLPIVLALASLVGPAGALLTDIDKNKLHSRLFQTNLRGPRFPGSEQANSFLESLSASYQLAGLTTSTLNYTMYRWDVRWWYLVAGLTNGTEIWVPTTGYYPYSGDTGVQGVTGSFYDAGSFAVDQATRAALFDALDLSGVKPGDIIFFDNPTVTRNYSAPEYDVFGTGRNISLDEIPELGNLTNPHWTGLAKKLDFTTLESLGVAAAISSWVDVSDEDAALQFLPKSALSGTQTQKVPTLYVGNSTGETLRSLGREGSIANLTVVLDAPSFSSPSYTLISHLEGTGGTDDTILIYTHSDGMNIIEENGPFAQLSIAEYFARNRPSINLDFVATTGHLASGFLNETDWFGQRPDLLANAKAAINLEHLGAVEWQDVKKDGKLVYEATGRAEPWWTFANDSSLSTPLRDAYLGAFDGTPDRLRVPLLDPLVVNGVRSSWSGVGGSSTLGWSQIPTLGILAQPDYLWKSIADGGWSLYDHEIAVAQIEAIIRTIARLDELHSDGTL
ncbi:hypothetical protein GQ53DRAFT_878308 [Thozetella sp. PMI_491]|nr:hypothetical protein GQ53DRAFT_878308 [Thozetella sp. PMI_491]